MLEFKSPGDSEFMAFVGFCRCLGHVGLMKSEGLQGLGVQGS